MAALIQVLNFYLLIIFVPVKRNIAVISFLISMMVVISHDLIPHHHVDPDESEMISDQPSGNHGESSSEDGKNHNNHFPLHQHLISDGDCINGRYTASVNKAIKDTHQVLDSLSTTFTDSDSHDYFTGFVRVIRKPLYSYQFIFSLNTTRGSPFIS